MSDAASLIQELIYFGALDDSEKDLWGFLMRHFKAVPRLNPRVTGATAAEGTRQLALTGTLAPPAGLPYLHRQGSEDSLQPISHWLAVDLSIAVSHLFLMYSVSGSNWIIVRPSSCFLGSRLTLANANSST